jgi:hypothetical protein
MGRKDCRSRTAVLLGAVVFAACGGDWQPQADGGPQAMGWDPTALAGGARIAWRTNVGKGHSAVVVRGRYLYTMGSEQRGSGKHDWFDVVRCLDAATGEVIWEYPYRCKKIYFPGPRATPALDGTLLYTLSWQGHVIAFNAEDGTVVWSRNLVADSLARPGLYVCGGRGRHSRRTPEELLRVGETAGVDGDDLARTSRPELGGRTVFGAAGSRARRPLRNEQRGPRQLRLPGLE